MDALVQRTVDALHEAAQRHDASLPNRLDRWRVLEPDAGRFLWFLAQAVEARRIVEIGTSRGVSTLYLADAARNTGGRVLSVDTDPDAQTASGATLAAAGVAEQVSLQVADGGQLLAELADGEVDLLFLDAERTEYPGWWPHPMRVLRHGGVLVADNALSHPAEIAPLRELLEREPALITTTIDVGKGELLAQRRG